MNRFSLRETEAPAPSQRRKEKREKGAGRRDEVGMERKAVLCNQGQGVQTERWKSGKDMRWEKIIKRRKRKDSGGQGRRQRQ